MHLALASRPDDPAFAPEAMTSHQQRSIYQSIHTLATRTLQLLQDQASRLPEPARAHAAQVLESQPRIFDALRDFLGRRLNASRIRVHGDFHLGQVLKTSTDFVIIDFEGEPARSFSERRIKRPALRDVAGMLRSFSYAVETGLGTAAAPELRRWASFWVTCVSAAYLRSYLETAGSASFVPRSDDETEILIRTLLLEKALYELRYELNSRPEMVDIPLRGILGLLDVDSSPRGAGGGQVGGRG
jgi:maltose alpha-D-glucosyltransferase/alpha-amylase